MIIHSVSVTLHEHDLVSCMLNETTHNEKVISLQRRHNECDGASNHRRLDCLLSVLFTRRSKKTSKLHVTGLCGGNSPVTGEFPAQRASNAKNVSIWWRHHIFSSRASVWRKRTTRGARGGVSQWRMGHRVWWLVGILIARFMGPPWGPPGADRALVGPMLAPWTLLSGFPWWLND